MTILIKLFFIMTIFSNFALADCFEYYAKKFENSKNITARVPKKQTKIQGISNQYEKIYQSFDKLIYQSKISTYMNRMIRKSIRTYNHRNNLKFNPSQYKSLKKDAIVHLRDGFESEVFCPLVKVTNNAKEKRKLFKKKEIINYLIFQFEKSLNNL